MTTLREEFGPILLSPAGFHSSLVETQRAWNRYDKIELEAEIARANRFLQLVGKRKSINKQFTSYALKHVVEHWTYSLPDHSGNAYVSEGCFLMAAQRLGFKIEPIKKCNSAYLGISMPRGFIGLNGCGLFVFSDGRIQKFPFARVPVLKASGRRRSSYA